MGFRLGTSIRILPGVRLRLTDRGVGASIGAGGLRFGVTPEGKDRVSLGIPGTGIRTSIRDDEPGAAALSGKRPGPLADQADKDLFAAIERGDWRGIEAVGQANSSHRGLALAISALHVPEDEADEASRLLESSLDTGSAYGEHPFIREYLPGAEFDLAIVNGFTVAMPFTADSLRLGLAECYQAQGYTANAIELVEGLVPTTPAAVSLVELYLIAGRYQEVIELTAGIPIEDDATAMLNIGRGVAFRELGELDQSRQALHGPFGGQSRAVRHLALSERAAMFEAAGKRAKARRVLERILKQDPDNAEVRQRLEALGNGKTPR